MKLRSKGEDYRYVNRLNDFRFDLNVLMSRYEFEIDEYIEDGFVLGYVDKVLAYQEIVDDYKWLLVSLEDGEYVEFDESALRRLVFEMKATYRNYKDRFEEASGWREDAIAWYTLRVTRAVTLDVHFGGRFDEIELDGYCHFCVRGDDFMKLLDEFHDLISDAIDYVDRYDKVWRTLE